MRRLLVLTVTVLTAVAAAVTAPPRAEATSRPMPVGVQAVRVTSAGPDQVRVTWRGGSRTTRYAFLAGSTSMTDRNHFETAWIPAADPRIRHRSILLTVPARLRPVLGAGSGDYVFVKLVQTNAVAPVPACRQWSPATLCRASASGSYDLAGNAATVAGPTFPLSVATWNVQSVSATAAAPLGLQWAARLPKVVRTVQAIAPQVLGTQESTTARLDPACLNPQGERTAAPCVEQYMSLAQALGPDYAVAGPDAWQWSYRQAARHAASDYQGYVDSVVYYRPDSIALITHGFISPVDDLGLRSFTTHDEAGAWALLSDRATGVRFLAASIHLPVGDSEAAARRSETVALSRWLTAKAASLGGVPIVLMGDLNSYAGTDPEPAVVPLRLAGFSDAAATRNRTFPRMSSTNASNSTGEASGYPVAAVLHPYPTNRIDYVLTRLGASAGGAITSTRYRNVVRLTPDGRSFDSDFQGSDHDMQVADLLVPIR